ncbi:MAG: hypothetical protein HY826_15225 [Actinobacteria bacterium]|nr:hypothetical protein [Actinomycetota bacterium]
MTNAVGLRRLITALGLTVTVALIASCSSSSGSPVSSSSIPDTAAATTTATTGPAVSTIATTALPTTSPAPTSAVVPSTLPPTTVPPPPLVLREDGLGPFDFGNEPSAVVAAITAQLGSPATDNALNYADASHVGSGYYQSLDGPYYYALPFPVGRTTCWTGEFCAEFGGASTATLTFIGWSYTGPVGALRSASNLTIAAKWSDFPSMIVYPTCYTEGGGTHHGIVLILHSAGFEWLTVDGAGNIVQHLPDPAATRVTRMSAGQEPFQPEADC